MIGIPQIKSGEVFDYATKTLNNALGLLKYEKRVDVVVIEAQDFWVIPRLGIMGSAIGKTCIEIKINFSRKDVNKIIEVELPATIYHELTHLVRDNSVGYGDTLLDSFISEGLSCFVEKLTFPNKKIPYIKRIKNEKALWSKARKILAETKYNHSEWFFGTGKLPNWTGYRLGYSIVNLFMKRNRVDLDKLVRMDSKDILDGGGLI